MKEDIETLLQKSRAPKPRRPLSPGFTERVLRTIERPPKREKREWWQRYIHIPAIRLLPKPLVVALIAAAVVATGGVAYAAVSNWANISVLFGGQQQLQSGNRIVSVDTENCGITEELDSKPGLERTPQPSGKARHYYEVKHDSPLTNEQVVDMVRGVCTERLAYNAVSAYMHDTGTDRQGTQNGGIFRIQDISSDEVTLRLDDRYDPKVRYFGVTDDGYGAGADLTLGIAPDAKAFDITAGQWMEPIAVSDLRADDSVMIVARKQGSAPPVSQENPNPWSSPDQTTIEALIKVPPLAGMPDTFYLHLGTDFVRTEPCDSHPSGFCRAYDFVENIGG